MSTRLVAVLLLTGAAAAAVVAPESTYSGRRTITLGGRTVQLIHPGPTGHAPDLTVLYFPAERVVFGVDFMAVHMVPGSNTLANGAPAAEYVAAVKAVEALENKKTFLEDNSQFPRKVKIG